MADSQTITKTFEEIATFDAEARQLRARYENEWRKRDEKNKDRDFPGTKLTYAIDRMLKRAQSVLGHYQEKIKRITVENAAVDKDGVLLVDDRNQFKFKPEGMKKRDEEQMKLFRSETTIEPYYCTAPPKTMRVSDADILMDFVLKERPAEPPEEEETEEPAGQPS